MRYWPVLTQMSAQILFVSGIAGQGTETKSAPAGYPVHQKIENGAIAADYLVRTVFGKGQTYYTDDYLVIEVAIFPDEGREMEVLASNFTLRLNGKREVLFSRPPAMVAASMKYPDYHHPRGLVVAAGPIIVGRPGRVERFPGDPRPQQDRLPGQPRVETKPSGVPPAEIPTAEEVVTGTALKEGAADHSLSGYLYFPYRGKLKSVKSVELLVRNGSDTAVLRLR
ncbi:MAG: hypothetical protein ACRD7E_25890 [Bryobacteraceae bacterium]